MIDFTKPSTEYSHYLEWQDSFSQLQKMKHRFNQAEKWLEEDGEFVALHHLLFRTERALQRHAKNLRAVHEQEVGDFLLSKEAKEKQLNELRLELVKAKQKRSTSQSKRKSQKKIRDNSDKKQIKTK